MVCHGLLKKSGEWLRRSFGAMPLRVAGILGIAAIQGSGHQYMELAPVDAMTARRTEQKADPKSSQGLWRILSGNHQPLKYSHLQTDDHILVTLPQQILGSY